MRPDIQLVLRPGIVEFGWGHLMPKLLPRAELAAAGAQFLARDLDAALVYGAEQGPGRLLRAVAEQFGIADDAALMITAGTSQALDLLCTLYSRPGDTVLVEAATYHLALRIFHDHGLQIEPIPVDADGLDPAAAAERLQALRAAGRHVAFLYTVPTFGNPRGVTLSAGRRRELADLAAEADLPVIEDDAYSELWYDAPAPAPIGSHRPTAPVIRLCSFAKVLAPGLRLGWLHAPPAIVQRLVGSGVLDSGGGVNHFTALLIAEFFRQGGYAPHLRQLRAALQERRDRLAAALQQHLPASARFTVPAGGFFQWIELDDAIDTADLLAAAEAAGVSYLPGRRFHSDGGGAQALRLSFSLLDGDELALGAERLGRLLQQRSGRG
jgi:2-aminoadipate transaminase